MTALAPASVKVKIVAPPERKFLSGLEDLFFLLFPLSRICGSKRTSMTSLALVLSTGSASKHFIKKEPSRVSAVDGSFRMYPKMHFTLLKLSSRNFSSGTADIPRVSFWGFPISRCDQPFSTTFHLALTLLASDTYDYFSKLLLIYCYVSYVDPI